MKELLEILDSIRDDAYYNVMAVRAVIKVNTKEFGKFEAYGFCHQVIQDAKLFKEIRLKDETGEWLIPTSFILNKNNAPFLHFKGNGGFEVQVFVPLKEIEQFKREERF